MKELTRTFRNAVFVLITVELAILTAVFVFGRYIRVFDATAIGIAFGLISILLAIVQGRAAEFNKNYTDKIDSVGKRVDELKSTVDRDESRVDKLELSFTLLNELAERSYHNTAEITALKHLLETQLEINERLVRLEVEAKFVQKQVDNASKECS
jgi:hypothetical protein